MTTLQDTYRKDIAPALKDELGLKSLMAVPRLQKVVINAGVGRYLAGSKDTTEIEAHLAALSGQKPVVTKAKKAISNFKIREGLPIGVMVTLRGRRAWDFLYKFINVSSPRIRDFRGFSAKSFDGNGNYSIGLRDLQIFPEIRPEKVTKPCGLQITFAFSGGSDKFSRALLAKFNFPFKKSNK